MGIAARVGDRRAVPQLVRLLDDTRELPNRAWGTLRELAAAALARITDPHELPDPIPPGSSFFSAWESLEHTPLRYLDGYRHSTRAKHPDVWKRWWEKHQGDYLNPLTAPPPDGKQ
ncbi:MAG: hypothetical protein AB1486_19740 [Planctomycetota bacterium]